MKRPKLSGEDLLMTKVVGKGSRHGSTLFGKAGDIAQQPPVWAATAFLLGLGGPRGRRAAMRGSVCYGAAALAQVIIKAVVGRDRPAGSGWLRAGPVTSSFPSGHAATDLAFNVGASQELPLLFFPLSAATLAAHWSIVRSRGHYLSDVLAGGGLGIVVALVAWWLWPPGGDENDETSPSATRSDRKGVLMSDDQQAPESPNQDVVDLLVEQHQQVKGLFSQVEQASGEARRDGFEQLVRLLAVHETAEEEIVYPAVRKMVDDGDTLADARTAEEDEAKTALSELEKLGVDHADFDSKLGSVKQIVLSHADKEEQEVFPELRESHSRDQLETMARGVHAAESFAPTHPHPHGPESALGNIAVGPFVAVADRVRDAIRQARR